MAETINPLLGRGQKIGSNTEVPILLRGGGGGASNPVDYAADLAKAAAEAPPPGLRAYHGSPYDFERFDSSKIGTGEGAQAYGRGLYFAENEAVAKEYKNSLKWKGSDWKDPNNIASFWTERFGDRGKAINYLDKLPPEQRKAPEIQQAIDLLGNEAASIRPPRPGKTYEVNIRAKPEEMLDWDKPIGEQSPQVQEAYKALSGAEEPGVLKARVEELQARMDAIVEDRYRSRNDPEWFQLAKQRDETWDQWKRSQSGRKFYEALGGSREGSAQAAEKLRAAGIKGIRFFDQGSRGKGEGTSNYVVFDDKIIDILKKYGIAGLMGSGAGVAALAGAPPPAQASDQPPPDYYAGLREGTK